MQVTHSKKFEPVTISILCETQQELDDLANIIRRSKVAPALAASREIATTAQREDHMIMVMLDTLRQLGK
jgi:hypothetical protein